MPTIGLIGLGNAGQPMAERILAQGFPLAVFDLNPAAMDTALRRGARSVRSAAEAVSDITITLLPSSVEVRHAVLGEHGVITALGSGKTLIDLSGTEPDCARELQEKLAAKRATFIGGTIHAGGAPAVVIPQGQFSIGIGGEKAQIEAVASF